MFAARCAKLACSHREYISCAASCRKWQPFHIYFCHKHNKTNYAQLLLNRCIATGLPSIRHHGAYSAFCFSHFHIRPVLCIWMPAFCVKPLRCHRQWACKNSKYVIKHNVDWFCRCPPAVLDKLSVSIFPWTFRVSWITWVSDSNPFCGVPSHDWLH